MVLVSDILGLVQKTPNMRCAATKILVAILIDELFTIEVWAFDLKY